MQLKHYLKRIFGTAVLCFAGFSGITAQTATENTIDPKLEQVIRQTDVKTLQRLSVEYKAQYTSNYARAVALAKARNMPLEVRDKQGNLLSFLRGVTATGQLEYYSPRNQQAAITTGTNQVHPGGGLGLNLTGRGMTLGMWEPGATRVSHREFSGRATQKDAQPGDDSHANHVAGTMIAAGVDPRAKGMAFEARLDCYTAENDLSEMAAAAAAGMLTSNHSYGANMGWTTDNSGSMVWQGDVKVSEDEDYRFGFYGDEAAATDRLMRAAPFYLPVSAAGNDRAEAGPENNGTYFFTDASGNRVEGTRPRKRDGDYNIVGPGIDGAKNSLTVGAIRALPNGYRNASEVQMTEFSCWGPMDDGRLKPEIVGMGQDVYSAYDKADDAYRAISGTSMASPGVAGSIALIQQHYHNRNNAYMRAATLRNIVMHSANDAGNPGPDYTYGYGVLNMPGAIAVINNNNTTSRIIEASLENGATYTLRFRSNGADPLRATLTWADVPGTPLQPTLNSRQVMLVNDLDMRLSTAGTSFLPYILSVENPAAAATRGDNVVDNVEQIFIPSPPPGEYTLTITHKRQLQDGAQPFSLIITGIAQQAPSTVTCVVPGNPRVSKSAPTTVDLAWDKVEGATSYVVSFREIGTEQYRTVRSTTETAKLTGLKPETRYEWVIQTNCGNNASAWSGANNFATPAPRVLCGTPAQATASNITSRTFTVSWEAVPGVSSYGVRYRINTTGAAWQDLANTTNTSVNVDGLTPNTAYTIQVRSICNEASTSAWNTATTVRTTAEVLSCDVPSGFVRNNTDNPARPAFSWDAQERATNYVLSYKEAVATVTTWTNINVSGTNYTFVEDLEGGKAYVFRVRSVCPGPDSKFSANIRYVVPAAPTCSTPTNFRFVPNGDNNTLTFAWDAPQGARAFTVEYSVNENFDNSRTASSVNPQIELSDPEVLSFGATVYARVKATCINGATSANSNAAFGNVGQPRLGGQVTVADFVSFPNPVNDSGILNVRFNSSAQSTATIAVTGVDGRTVVSRVVAVDAGQNIQTLELGKVSTGLYLVRLTIGTQTYQTRIAVR